MRYNNGNENYRGKCEFYSIYPVIKRYGENLWTIRTDKVMTNIIRLLYFI